MQRAKQITRIAFKKPAEPGERGERGAVPRIRKFSVSLTWFSGASGEEFLDYAYYNGRYYRCLVTHTPRPEETPWDEVMHGYDTWSLESNFEFIASGVAFIGEGEDGWIIDNGRIYHNSGKIELSKDGSIKTSNGAFQVDKNGNMIATSGSFSGFILSRFTTMTSNMTLSSQENIVAPGGYNAVLTLPTDISFSGRRVCVVSTHFPPYTRAGLMFSTSIRVASGYLRGLGEYADVNTPAYKQIEIRGGMVELVAVPSDNSISWLVASGHESIVAKYTV